MGGWPGAESAAAELADEDGVWWEAERGGGFAGKGLGAVAEEGAQGAGVRRRQVQGGEFGIQREHQWGVAEVCGDEDGSGGARGGRRAAEKDERLRLSEMKEQLCAFAKGGVAAAKHEESAKGVEGGAGITLLSRDVEDCAFDRSEGEQAGGEAGQRRGIGRG